MKMLQNNYGGNDVPPGEYRKPVAYYEKPWREAIKSKLDKRVVSERKQDFQNKYNNSMISGDIGYQSDR